MTGGDNSNAWVSVMERGPFAFAFLVVTGAEADAREHRRGLG
jgi:hypothetical protein